MRVARPRIAADIDLSGKFEPGGAAVGTNRCWLEYSLHIEPEMIGR